MNTDGLAPPVPSILDAARDRTSDGRVAVDARALPGALSDAAGDGRRPLIAEVKPTSPTTDGDRSIDPVVAAEAMVAGGAAALSVLTEPEHFGGSPGALRRVRDAVDVPVLRKDFVLSEGGLDVVAADAVLLIARFLDDLGAMVDAARDRGMQPLVEVHSREEARAAVDAGADLVGINNRDLARLDVDLETFERVAPAVPDDATLLAESGIASPADADRMRAAGADGLLVGSAVMAGVEDADDADRAAATIRGNVERLTAARATATDGGTAGRADRPTGPMAERLTTAGTERGDR
jgi:indole-3-glycerol phosphate synthase